METGSDSFSYADGNETVAATFWSTATSSQCSLSVPVQTSFVQRFKLKKSFEILADGFWREAVVPTGARGSAKAAGLRASSHGGHEEVDDPAGQERAGVFSTAAQHGCHGGETGPVPARGWSGLHQSAEQGEIPSSLINSVWVCSVLGSGI